MAKRTKTLKSMVLRMLEQKRIMLARKKELSVAPGHLQTQSSHGEVAVRAAVPTGSCRYADGLGQFQCESPVTQSYCDGKSGFFTPGGRC